MNADEAIVAQLVRASVCGTEGRGFKSHRSPHKIHMRKSTVTKHTDAAGEFEAEVFDCENPKSVVICSHGNGVRRWDGENFFYNVANHYGDRAFYLVDQTQVIEEGCELIDLQLMVQRVQSLVIRATEDHPGVPITVLAHSMGCGVASLLDTKNVSRMILAAPASGNVVDLMVSRYGENILEGGLIRTSDGLNKLLSKEYVQSVDGVAWEEKYQKLLQNFKDVYVFESADDEILTEERKALVRPLPFKSLVVIEGATHNLHGEALEKLYQEIDDLI